MRLMFNAPEDLIKSIGNTLNKGFLPNKDNLYPVCISEEGQILGMFELRHATDRMIEVHINILPKYWGGDIGNQSADCLIDYLTNSTEYRVLLTTCPEECEISRKFVERNKFSVSCVYPKAITYNETVQDLIQYMRLI